jgi:hypothetical protein
MLIANCEIKEVKTKPQSLRDGDTKVTTIAHVVGTLDEELAVILVGQDGARALFSPHSWLKSGPVTREPDEGTVSVAFGDNLFLPSCGVSNIKVNGMTEKVSFDVCCERAGDLLYAQNIAHPDWRGTVEIKALQGQLFPDVPAAAVTTDDDGQTLFKGTPEEIHQAAEAVAAGAEKPVLAGRRRGR